MSFGAQKVLRSLSSGHTYSYIHTIASVRSETFLLLHGFPSTSLVWNKLSAQLTKAGYGVLAIDLLGCGDSSKPTDVQEYALSRISEHVKEIMVHEQLDQVIGVGHDWGAMLLARMWWFCPEFFSSLVFMTVPYQTPQPLDLDTMNFQTKDMFGYEMGGYWYFLTSPETPAIMAGKVSSNFPFQYKSNAQYDSQKYWYSQPWYCLS